jgi:hypothetical protein
MGLQKHFMKVAGIDESALSAEGGQRFSAWLPYIFCAA